MKLSDEIKFDLENINDRLSIIQLLNENDIEISTLKYQIKRLKIYLKKAIKLEKELKNKGKKK